GGLAFDASAEWPVFGAGRFIIPRITLADGVMTLAVMDPADIHQAKQDLQRIRFEFGDFPNSLPRLISKNYLPNRDGWDARVREALSLIQNEALEKIVLSRQTNLQFESRLNPISLAHELSRTTHDCFVFCFNFGPESSFLGATPERLFYRHGQVLQSEVVAGTRMRGSNVEEDQNLEQDLLDSDKDQREHDIVRKSIRQKLHKFVEQLEVDSQASILKLARKQHLRSNVLGMLKPDVDDGMLLSRLHPTPAVGGYPTDNALPEIARIEPFNRGWYAAPVGWIGSDSAHFAVAIRSGWAVADRLSLFSGAGIVRGSRPEAEWEEVENKIQDFLSIFRD
ncbi:MAG: isochorismate synthase, partial [Planctomycetota bacterium]